MSDRSMAPAARPATEDEPRPRGRPPLSPSPPSPGRARTPRGTTHTVAPDTAPADALPGARTDDRPDPVTDETPFGGGTPVPAPGSGPETAWAAQEPAPVFDPAHDDTELVTARAALTQGRRQAVRALLLRTGDDWDRRGHRLTVLAEEPYAAAWARDWLTAEPGSADAAALLALALVQRALRGKESSDTAREACRDAAALAPADPTPWLGLLILERAAGGDEAMARVFDEVRDRHPEHHHAHHLTVARLAERGTGPDPRHGVYEFADREAALAPADSPLALLPVVARAERYRVLAAAAHEPADPAASGHWTGSRARQATRAAFDWWLEWEHDDHPRRHVDLNFLAHAMTCQNRTAEAAALFQRIGRHATPAPWSYPDRDPDPAFRAARTRVLGC